MTVPQFCSTVCLRILLAAACLAFAQEPNQPHAVEYPTPLVREEIRIAVNGVPEKWQLRWSSRPAPLCEPNELSLTCPCIGFAYGESGELALTRSRGSIEIDRLDLTPHFKDSSPGSGGLAVVRRWEPDYDKDFEASEKDDFTSSVAKRPVVRVMELADYDHDGQQTEFFLQTNTLPCGKRQGMVIGTSKQNPKLHVFDTADNPKVALLLQESEWDALRTASGPFAIEDWHCGDHGSETQTILRINWTSTGITGRRLEYSCPPLPKKLLSDNPL